MSDAFPQVHEQFVTLGRWRSRALQLGPTVGTGPRLLFLHGWGDCAEAWLPLFAELQALQLPMIALDFPGAGQAQPLAPGPQLPQYIDFAGEALRHYGEQGPLLPVGQSLGARALMTALNQQAVAGVRSVVAVGPAPIKLPGWQQVLIRNAGLVSAVAEITHADDAHLIDELVQSHRRTCFHRPERIPAQVFADYARYVSADRARNHVERLRQFGAEVGQPLDFGQLQLPVELIWGANDRIAPVAGARDYQAALISSALTIIDDCGHHAHIENPPAIAAVVRRALEHYR